MQVMVPHRFDQFFEDLTYLVESGKVPMSRIDDAVERILRVKFVAGLFEYPFSDRSLLNIVGCKVKNSTYALTSLHVMNRYSLENIKFLSSSSRLFSRSRSSLLRLHLGVVASCSCFSFLI